MMSSQAVSLADELQFQFASNAKKLGRQAQSTGKVRIELIGEWHLAAKVIDSEIYDTKLWINPENDDELVTNCTCSFFNNQGPCKHLFATLIEIDQIRAFEPPDSELDLQMVPLFQLEPHEGSLLSRLELQDPTLRLNGTQIGRFRPEAFAAVTEPVTTAKTSGGRTKLPPLPKPAIWRSQLESISQLGRQAVQAAPVDLTRSGSREIWFVINVGDTLTSTGLRIEYFQRERKQNGQFGKLKKYPVRDYDLPKLGQTQAEQLLATLSGQHEPDYHYSYRSVDGGCTIRRSLQDVLLPKLCQSGRLIWALDPQSLTAPPTQTLVWDDGAPWRFRVNVVEDRAAQVWRMTGELFRAETGEVISATKGPVCLMQYGLVLFPDCLARLDAHDEFPWIVQFRKQAEIVVPFADRESFMSLLWTQSGLPLIEAPEDLRADRIVGEPRGRIVFEKLKERYAHSDRYSATIFFRYSEEPLLEFPLKATEGGSFEPVTKRVISRDLQKEAEWLATLQGTSLSAPFKYGHQIKHDYELWKFDLTKVVPVLLDNNWIVESDSLQFHLPGELRLDVESQVDWFDLTGGVDFGGETVSFPKLLKALKDNQRFVTLKDGSQGLVPGDLLKKFLSLASLADASGNTIRFKKSQGLLLDALLASQKNVTFDKQFDHFRTKVRAFAGVAAVEPTTTFTGQLRDYQKEGLGWLHFLRDFGLGGCLADDMGLGKTVQVLALLEARRTRSLTKDEVRRPSLVVVPKSLVFNWIDEAKRFAAGLRIHNFTGVERELPEPSEYDVLLTTYATMRIEILPLSKQHFDYAILDEATAIKNAAALAAKASRLIVADHRLAMTGTPVENHLGELWSLFEFLNPGMLGASTAFQSFSRKTANENGSVEMLAQALRPYLLRRTKEQVLPELPEKMEQTIFCELSPKERKRYDELRDYYKALLSGTIKTRGMAKSKIHVKRRQI